MTEEISGAQLRAVAAILGLPLHRNKVTLTEEIASTVRKAAREAKKEAAMREARAAEREAKRRRSVSRGGRRSVSRAKGRRSVSRGKKPQGRRRVSSYKPRSLSKRRSVSRGRFKRNSVKGRRSVSRGKGRRSVSRGKKTAKGRRSVSRGRRSVSRAKGRRSVSRGKRVAAKGALNGGAPASRALPVKLADAAFNEEAYLAAVKRMADQGYRKLVAALWCCHGSGSNKLWILMRKPGTTASNERVTIWGSATGSPRHTYGGVAGSDADFVDSKLAKGYVRHGSLNRKIARILK